MSNLWQTLPSSVDLGSDSWDSWSKSLRGKTTPFVSWAGACLLRSSKNRDGPAFPRTRDFGLGLPSLTQTKAGIGKTTPVLDVFALIGGLLPLKYPLPEPFLANRNTEHSKGCKEKELILLQFCSLSCCLCIFLYAARFPLRGWALIHKGWEPWKPLRHLKGKFAVRSRLRVEWGRVYAPKGKSRSCWYLSLLESGSDLFSRFF